MESKFKYEASYIAHDSTFNFWCRFWRGQVKKPLESNAIQIIISSLLYEKQNDDRSFGAVPVTTIPHWSNKSESCENVDPHLLAQITESLLPKGKNFNINFEWWLFRLEQEYLYRYHDCGYKHHWLLTPFDGNNFDTDYNFLVEHKIFNTATNILVKNEFILNSCYEVPVKYQLPRMRTTCFLASFIPQSINI